VTYSVTLVKTTLEESRKCLETAPEVWNEKNQLSARRTAEHLLPGTGDVLHHPLSTCATLTRQEGTRGAGTWVLMAQVRMFSVPAWWWRAVARKTTEDLRTTRYGRCQNRPVAMTKLLEILVSTPVRRGTIRKHYLLK
jgi:hypothetical protein